MATKSTRAKTQIYLLDGCISEMTGSKLPSLRMALGLFLHHHIELKATIRESSVITVREVTKFWDKARIPIQDPQNCHTKLEKIFEEWRLLKKNKGRQSETQKNRESAFSSRLDDIFDIAHTNALSMMTVAEDKDFLLAQREKGRRGTMAGLDKVLAAKEKRVSLRKEVEAKRRRRLEDSQETEKATALLSSSSSESENVDGEEMVLEAVDATSSTTTPSSSTRKRGRQAIMSPELASALDRSKVSDRKATFVIAETAKSLGHSITSLALNRSSIRRQRMEYRAQIATKLKEEFRGDVPLVVHWDGKLIQDLTGNKTVDRLPVLVSGQGVSQLLYVAKLPSGTGASQATAVYDALQDWGIVNNIQAMSFDTTSSNTGTLTGACTLLEGKMERKLLHLACRHHIMELLIGAAFSNCMGPSSGPEILLFKRFKKNWATIDNTKFQTGSDCEDVASALKDVKGSILEFANKQLDDRESALRDDYREFLELAIIFLGEVPVRGIRFMAPGAMHQARWMAKVLYSIKVWLFRSQFHLTKREEKGLRDICIFAVRVYLKAWITAPAVAAAPYNDFTLLKKLLDYSSVNKGISEATSKKLANHLWYLSQDLIGLAFFDCDVPVVTKRLMLKAMQEVDGKKDAPKRILVDLQSFREKKFEDFITKDSGALFKSMNISDGFLQCDPNTWDDREDFRNGLKTVCGMKVVNDHAERGVALIQEYSGLLTSNEPQLQFLLQVVQDHRRLFPDCRKQTLVGSIGAASRTRP